MSNESTLFRCFREYECPSCKKKTYIGRILDTDLKWCPSCGYSDGLKYVETLYFPEDSITTETEEE